jgi:hypothetical protein
MPMALRRRSGGAARWLCRLARRAEPEELEAMLVDAESGPAGDLVDDRA